MVHTETARLQNKNKTTEREKQETMEKLRDCEVKNEMLAKKIEEAEETLAELQSKNKQLENGAKEMTAECDALKQTLEQITINSDKCT